MHYVFREDFKIHDDNLQPYNFYIERSSNLEHLHGSVKDGGYAISAPGNKHLFITPPLENFQFKTSFLFCPTILVHANWMMFFAYDSLTRNGKAVMFEYSDSYDTVWKGFVHYSLKISILEITPHSKKVVSEKVFNDVKLSVETYYDVNVNVSGKSIIGTFNGIDFFFKLENDVGRGIVGIGRDAFVGEVVFRNVELHSDENIEPENILSPLKVELPSIHGGAIPYRLSLRVKKYTSGPYLLQIKFSGGMWDRKTHLCHPGQYCVEADRFQNAALILKNSGFEKKINLKNGLLAVIDDSLHYDFLKDYFHAEKTPIRLEIALEELPLENLRFVFVYDMLKCTGYLPLSGGPSEFIYDTEGHLLYSGERLAPQNIMLSVTSSADDLAKSLPHSLVQYEKAYRHAKNNHYFIAGEKVEFELKVFFSKESFNSEYLNVAASLADVFFETFDELPPVGYKHGTFENFQTVVYRFKLDNTLLTHGVYHIIFNIAYGSENVRQLMIVFEIINPAAEKAPPLASGLPFLFSTANEESLLAGDTFDPWGTGLNSNPSHYFSCACFTPEVGQRYRVWEVLKFYKREWYMWLDSRTEADWSPELFSEALSHVDYLSYPNPTEKRGDLWKRDEYNSKVLEIVEGFLDEVSEAALLRIMTKDYVAQLKSKNEFPSFDALEELLAIPGNRWFEYYGKKVNALTIAQTEKFEALNPKIKRAKYGPWPVYTARWKSHYFMRCFGYFPNGAMQRIFKGFMQFEDYSFLCSYHTCAAPWGLMGFQLFYPGVKVYPELYDDIVGGCPDGALAYAAPPLGERKAPDYYQIAAAYEYAFSTARRTAEKYEYWSDYGFMFRDARPSAIHNLVRAWRHVYKHKPAVPMRSIAYILDIAAEDNHFYKDFLDLHKWPEYFNHSEDALGYVNMVARMSGIPAGFGTRFDFLESIRAEETSLIVLPSLKCASPRHLKELRRLHSEGVALLGVSNIDGLEDLFGVVSSPRKKHVCAIKNAHERELIFPFDLELNYDSTVAETLLSSAEGDGLLFRHGATALFNADPVCIGRDSFFERVMFAKESVSNLLRKVTQKLLLSLNEGKLPFLAKGSGSMGFTDVSGERCIVLTDYSDFDDRRLFDDATTVSVELNIPGVKALQCEEKKLNLLMHSDIIKGFTCQLKPREAVFITLSFIAH